MIAGVRRKMDDDDEDEDETGPRVYTAADVAPVRHVLLTERRKKLLIKKHQLRVGTWDNGR